MPVQKDYDPSTHTLARFGETDEMKKLMTSEVPVDINARDKFDATPLVWASRNGHDETVKYLFSINADLHTSCFGGWSALQHAVSKSRENMVALLLQNDANPNAFDDTGTGVLHIAAARGAINIVARLIEAHADVNTQNAAGMRPLHYGALFGHATCVKKLAEHGADVDAQDAEGNTPLHLAAQMGFESVVQFLLSLCNKRIANKNAKLPLDFACNSLIQKLLK